MTVETARILAKAVAGTISAEHALSAARTESDEYVVQAAEAWLAQFEQLAAVIKAVRA